jgi:hypothetical protein
MNTQLSFSVSGRNLARYLPFACLLLALLVPAQAGSPQGVVWERTIGDEVNDRYVRLLRLDATTSGGLLLARTQLDPADGPLQPPREWCHVHVFNASGEETTNTLMGHFRDPFSYYSAGNAVAMMDTRDGGYFYVDNYVWPDYNFALQETYKEIIQKFDGGFNLQWHYVNPPDFGQWKRADYIHDVLEPTSGTYLAVGNMGQTRAGTPPPTVIYEDFVYLFCAKKGTPAWYRTFPVGTQTGIVPGVYPGYSKKRHSLAPATNGDFYVAGYTYQPPNSYIARLSDKGEERWLVRPKPTDYSLRWLQRTSESKVLVAGERFVPKKSEIVGSWAAVYREDGSMAWTQEYPQIEARAFDSYPGGGFLLAGAIPDADDNNTSYPRVVRMDNAGKELWRQTLPQDDFWEINGCIALKDGGCLLVGIDRPTSGCLGSVVCLDGQGQVRWRGKYGQQFLSAHFTDVHQFPNGEILLIGDAKKPVPGKESGVLHVYLVKLAAERAAGKEWDRYADAPEESGANAAGTQQGPPSGSGGPAGGGGPRNPLVWIAALAGGGAVALLLFLRASRGWAHSRR